MTVDRAVGFIQTSEVRPFPCTPIMIYPNECLWTGLNETNHLYRGPPRKVELFNARKLVHAYDVNLVSVCVPQYVQVLHELIVIFGNQHPPTPILPRNIGDDKIRIPSSSSFRARRPDRGIPNRTPQGRLQARRRVQRRFGVPAVNIGQSWQPICP